MGWGDSLLDIAGALFAIALAGERFLGAALFTWLQVKRVSLDLFYDVLLLNFALETAKGTFESFAVLQMDFCQLNFHHLPGFPVARGASRLTVYCNAERDFGDKRVLGRYGPGEKRRG